MHAHTLRTYVGPTRVEPGRTVHLWRCSDRACGEVVHGPVPLTCLVCHGSTEAPDLIRTGSPWDDGFSHCDCCHEGHACCEGCTGTAVGFSPLGTPLCPDCLAEETAYATLPEPAMRSS